MEWHKGKGEIRDPQNLNMWLDVNGEKRQRGDTKTMISAASTPKGELKDRTRAGPSVFCDIFWWPALGISLR